MKKILGKTVEIKKGVKNEELMREHAIMMTYCFGHHPCKIE